MNFRKLMIYFATLVVTILLLVGVRAVQSNLDAQVARHHLRYTGNIRNAPPLVVVTTVALGSFRGVIADLLWLRAESLKQKRSYYEMVQLAQWITDLQPSFAGATAYLAWNMAYNISVTCSDFGDRWRWVKEGIRLLRDKAIEYNPDDPRLYKELAWIFAHKIGNVMDDANIYYKNALAFEMQGIFGRFPDWEPMAAAPKDKKAFLKAYPAESPLWALIPAGDDPGEKYDRLYADFKASAPELPGALAAAGAETRKAVLAYLRAELLRERCRLESEKVLEINRKYGELDWRTSEAQAIYWALESIDRGVAAEGKREINTDRIVNNALYQSFVAGRIMKLDPVNYRTILLFPNLSLMDAVYRIYTEGQTYHDGKKEFNSSFRTARINFLKEAIPLLVNYGAFSKAEKYFKLLVEDDGPQKQEFPDGRVEYYRTLEDFARAWWIETIKCANAKQATESICGLIYCCIVNELSGDHEQAVAYERNARYVYNFYLETISRNNNDKRMEIPPYNVLKLVVQEQCLEMLPPDQARRLRTVIENEVAEIQAQQRAQERARRAAEQPAPPPAGK